MCSNSRKYMHKTKFRYTIGDIESIMMFYSYYKLDKHIAIIISLFQNRRSMYMLTELVQ